MKARRQRQSGAAMAEFAVIASVVIMVLVGIMEFGLGLFAYNFTASAANRASRYAIVRGAACTSWAAACPASADDITNYVRSLAPPGIDPGALTVTTVWTPDNAPGSEVSVTVQYNFPLDIPFIPAAAIPLSSESGMVISQ